VARKSRSELVQEVGLDGDDYVHIGDLGYLDGRVFVPIESKDHDDDWLLLGLDEELHVVGYSLMPHDKKDSFVAINPWNELLYVCSRLEETNHLYAYDVSRFLQVPPHQYGMCVDTQPPEDEDRRSISFLGEDGNPDNLHGVQGVSFSEDGYVFLAWYQCRKELLGECVEWANHIRVYNALTGMFLHEKEYDFPDTLDEIEGLSVHPSGVLYVAVSNHEILDTDYFEIYAFQ
jgi:hypothetical protein